jgi:hypothetical protein
MWMLLVDDCSLLLLMYRYERERETCSTTGRGIYALKGGMRPHITLIGDGTDALERVSTSFHLFYSTLNILRL